MYFGFGLPLNEPYDTISKDVTSPPAAASWHPFSMPILSEGSALRAIAPALQAKYMSPA
jgi:hypothetical protein